ncbi:MAG: Jag N-terminal domain-containing protein [Deltaproteobacteria bacterium]|nr:Jag N-terminal domain-containing protein [Deltaproteobacteria bacterium]
MSEACAHFGVVRDALMYELLRGASKGVFGIGGSPARIRAWVAAPIAASQAAQQSVGDPSDAKEINEVAPGTETPAQTASALVAVSQAAIVEPRDVLVIPPPFADFDDMMGWLNQSGQDDEKIRFLTTYPGLLHHPKIALRNVSALDSKGRHGEALEALLNVRLRPDDPEEWFELAGTEAFLLSPRSRDACAAYVRRLLQTQPTNPECHLSLILSPPGPSDPSWEEYQRSVVQAARLAPTSSEVVRVLSSMFEKAGDLRHAVEAADRSIALASDESDLVAALVRLGCCYDAAECYEEAIDAHKRSLELDPRNSYALSSVAHCYQMLGQRKSAVKYARRALLWNPGNRLALVVLEGCE